MKRRDFLLASPLLLAHAGPLRAADANQATDLTPLDNELEKHPRCVVCNMDRRQYHYARHLLHYGDGHAEGTCSINCAAECMLRERRRGFTAIYAPDYGVAGEPKPLIEVATATYLIGSDLRGVMSPVSKYAFSQRTRAEAVQAVAGGRLGTFAEALAAALEDYARSLNRRYDGDREKLKRQGKLS